jgi:hypothetical protein
MDYSMLSFFGLTIVIFGITVLSEKLDEKRELKLRQTDSKLQTFYFEMNTDFIAFIDCDDVWLSEKLSIQLGYMLEKNALFSCTNYYRVNGKGNILALVGVPEEISFNRLLISNRIGCSTVIIDSDLIRGERMPNLRSGQDYAFWLQILRLGTIANGVQIPLSNYRVQDTSLSSNKRKSALGVLHILRCFTELNPVQIAFCFSSYAVRGILRSICEKIGFYRIGFKKYF